MISLFGLPETSPATEYAVLIGEIGATISSKVTRNRLIYSDSGCEKAFELRFIEYVFTHN